MKPLGEISIDGLAAVEAVDLLGPDTVEIIFHDARDGLHPARVSQGVGGKTVRTVAESAKTLPFQTAVFEGE